MALRYLMPVVGAIAIVATSNGAAFAQASGCQAGADLFKQRQGLIAKAQSFAKSKPSPAVACSTFGALAANTTKTIAWVEANAAWCQIPDQVLENLKNDQGRVAKVRANACSVAAKQQQMQKQAQQNGGLLGGSAGGDIVTGPMRIPPGAL